MERSNMNKNEFIHRAIIAQMSNPYAFGSEGNIFRMSPSDIIDKAQDMADFVEQEGIPFDALPMNDGYVHTPLGNFRLSVDKEEPEDKDRLDELNYLIERYKEMIRTCPQELLDTPEGKDWRGLIERRLASYTEERDRLMHERTQNH